MGSILVVDDDAAMRSVICRALQRSGYRTLEAGDGREALEVLARHEVSVMVTDVIMPDVEGIELLQQVRRAHPGLRSIAISGGGRLDPEFCLHLAQVNGAARTLTKPFSLAELTSMVDEVLQS